MADVSRQSWIDNTSVENVRVADRVFVLLNKASEYVYAPGYTQSYIGVRSGDKPCNFFTVTPKKKDAVISIRVIQTAETDAGVKAASADGTFQYKGGWYGVHLDPNGDYTSLIPVLLQAEKEFKKEKGDAALTKSSDWKDAAAEMAELEKNAAIAQADAAAAVTAAQAAAEKAKAEAAAAIAAAQAAAEKAKAEAAAMIAAAQAEAQAAAKKAKAEAAAAVEAAKAAPATKTNHSTGALNGLFSVGENKKVRFSMGNLQFNAKKYEWRFAEHQYDAIGQDNEKIAPNYDGWIDLFGWGTSGYMGCEPFETSKDYKQYPNQDIANTNYDWGVYNPITNGGNKEGLWRTLTRKEWKYLSVERSNAQKLCIKACVNGVNGMLLLPDDFYDHRVRIPLDSTPSDFSSNSYDLTQWATLEAAGVVFLPSTGYRYEKVFYTGCGRYWSSSRDSLGNAHYFNAFYFNICVGNTYGCSGVRLAQDVK